MPLGGWAAYRRENRFNLRTPRRYSQHPATLSVFAQLCSPFRMLRWDRIEMADVLWVARALQVER